MSSLSISGAGQGLYAFLQGPAAGNAPPGIAATAAAKSSIAAAEAANTAPNAQSAQQGTRSTKHRHAGKSVAFKQIEDAVTTALQSVQPDGSTDPNRAIEDAIAKVFKNATNAAPGATTDGEGAGPEISEAAGAATTAPQNDSNHAAFLEALQSLGVSPAQFKTDFLAAAKSALGGQIDPGSALKNLPLGSMLDMTG